MRTIQYVVKKTNGRAVVGEGNSRATAICPTQQEAVERANAIARNRQSEVVIYGDGGEISTVTVFRNPTEVAAK